MSASTPGGWTSFDFTLTPHAKDAFETALHGLMGIHCVPIAFASQAVNGTNFAFLCEAEYASGHPDENVVVVRIHQPTEGLAHLVSITPIHP